MSNQIGEMTLVIRGESVLGRTANHVGRVPIGDGQVRLDFARNGLIEKRATWLVFVVDHYVNDDFLVADAERFTRIQNRFFARQVRPVGKVIEMAVINVDVIEMNVLIQGRVMIGAMEPGLLAPTAAPYTSIRPEVNWSPGGSSKRPTPTPCQCTSSISLGLLPVRSIAID